MKQKERQKIAYNQDILELERRRIRAVQKVLDGVKQTEVTKEFKVTDGAISQWMSSYKEYGWDGFKVHLSIRCDCGSHRPLNPLSTSINYRSLTFY